MARHPYPIHTIRLRLPLAASALAAALAHGGAAKAAAEGCHWHRSKPAASRCHGCGSRLTLAWLLREKIGSVFANRGEGQFERQGLLHARATLLPHQGLANGAPAVREAPRGVHRRRPTPPPKWAARRAGNVVCALLAQ